jgi:recombination protein RecR
VQRCKSATAQAASANGFVEPREIILATNPTMEGEATAMYIAKQLKTVNPDLKITRIGRGLPTGADIEYADPTTLDQAISGRQDY